MTAMEKALPCRIDTDKGALQLQRERGISFRRIGLLLGGLLLLPVLLLIALRNWNALFVYLIVLGFLLPVLLLPALLFWLARRRQDKQFDQHFICGPQKLVCVKNGKPVSATPYTDIWLGSDTLLLRDKPHPLYIGQGKSRIPLWLVHDVQREIGRRIPPTQFFASDYDMGRALLGRRPLLGLRLILARFTVVAVVLLVLGLKLFSFLDHLHVFSLWKIFHPR